MRIQRTAALKTRLIKYGRNVSAFHVEFLIPVRPAVCKDERADEPDIGTQGR
jgi:hypothetical protein